MKGDKTKNKTPKNIIFVMTLLGGSVILEAVALIFQFYQSGILNVSVFW